MTLQQQVQQHLDSTGISLSELARRSGISHQAIGNIRALLGEYKNGTADALRIAIKPKTLDATVEKLAVQRVNADMTHHAEWDVDLQCAKYRRVMQLEQQLNDANTAYLSSKSQHERDLQRLNDAQDKLEYMKLLAGEDGRKLQDYQAQISKQDAWIEQEDGARNILQSNLRDANAEIKRLTALSQTHGQSWKAACVQAEQLQRELKAADSRDIQLFKQKLDLNNEIEFLKEQCVERENAETLHDQQVMRLRVYVWILIAALVLVVASGLLVWGAA